MKGAFPSGSPHCRPFPDTHIGLFVKEVELLSVWGNLWLPSESPNSPNRKQTFKFYQFALFTSIFSLCSVFAINFYNVILCLRDGHFARKCFAFLVHFFLRFVVFSVCFLLSGKMVLSFLNRKYKLATSEKFDEYMKAMGEFRLLK